MIHFKDGWLEQWKDAALAGVFSVKTKKSNVVEQQTFHRCFGKCQVID